MRDLAIEIDLERARTSAERGGALLRMLRSRHDLARFEFTRHVRVAPLEIPHSHPVLTVNTSALDDENRFLATYLHEQMHWYLTDHRETETSQTIEELHRRYPDAPPAAEERARDDVSVYLHLVVNWLEVEVVGSLLGRSPALRLFQAPQVYPWCYATLIRDWDALEALYLRTGIAPILDARHIAGG